MLAILLMKAFLLAPLFSLMQTQNQTYASKKFLAPLLRLYLMTLSIKPLLSPTIPHTLLLRAFIPEILNQSVRFQDTLKQGTFILIERLPVRWFTGNPLAVTS